MSNSGRFEIKLQAIAARPEDRGENSNATQYIRRTVDLLKRKGKIQGIRKCDCLEVSGNRARIIAIESTNFSLFFILSK